ncbi:hypothetical protein HY623_03770 [Candidatus Uhrbacteria bacterium]|nr:hypothetical protein [Candidatus Uhrbacteria bacterium]
MDKNTVDTTPQPSCVSDVYRELLEHLELPEVEQSFEKLVHDYLNACLHLDRLREAQRDPRAYAMTHYKLIQWFATREARFQEMQSEDIKNAESLQRELYPRGIPKGSICIDVRVSLKLLAGLHEGSFRTPAGDNDIDFLPSEKPGDSLFVQSGGEFAKMLDRAFASQDVVIEILDSHSGCAAARSRVQEKIRVSPADNGLRDDVLKKKRIARAMTEYCVVNHPGKYVIPIHTSFDPHSGFLFMGLEKNEVINDARVVQNGYTEPLLHELASEGKIISTQLLLDDPHIRALLSTYFFDMDLACRYAHDTLRLWTKLQGMSHDALPLIEKKLTAVFPELKSEGKSEERKERALILLTNTFIAFLHNYHDDDSKKPYPYGVHDESVIVITRSEKGPYAAARAFNDDPRSPKISEVIIFEEGIIRDNRTRGDMSEPEKNAVRALYGADGREHVGNPVLVFFFERIENGDEQPSPELVHKLRSADWSTLSATNDWMTMSKYQFFSSLDSIVAGIPEHIKKLINTLRERAIELYRPGQSATEGLLSGRLIPVWTLAGPNRETIALFPFMAKGYNPKNIPHFLNIS